MRIISALALTIVVLAPAAGIAQTRSAPTGEIAPTPAGVVYELVLDDGTEAFGSVERVTGELVTFRTVAGATIEVPRGKIVTLRVARGRLVNGEFLRADPNPTRLFFAPTGRSLKRGEAYFGVYEIVMPFVQVGVTDRISVGAGTPLVFGGGSEHPFWITPKVQVLSVKNTEAAVGVMHFMNVGDGSFGIAYGVVTQGTTDSAFTGGLGYAYERYGEDDGSAVAMIGGEHRVSRRVKVISENYVWRGGGIASVGVRWLGDRLSADFGLAMPLDGEVFFAFPMINFVWKVGRN